MGEADGGQAKGHQILYVAVGPTLTPYGVDGGDLQAAVSDAATVSAPIQYVWPHPTRRILYVASSNRFSSTTNDIHQIAAFAMAPGSGKLTPIGAPTALGSRPIHITLDQTGAFLIAAYNAPSAATVHPIHPDGTVGAALHQASPLDVGVYAHQARMLPSNRTLLLVARGNDPSDGKPEDPGALKLFAFDGGELADQQSVAPGGGYGFGPRHVDFHPTRPWAYVAMERENQLHCFTIDADDRLSPEPIFAKTTLANPGKVQPGQAAGAIHVSADGRFLYLSNRADAKIDHNGQPVFAGGENSIAVFAIDQNTGEPTLIQSIDTQSHHVRTFSIDPARQLLVAASVAPMPVATADGVTTNPALLSSFSIGPTGELTFLAKQPVATTAGAMFWCGFIPQA